jgi:hypothetical protein
LAIVEVWNDVVGHEIYLGITVQSWARRFCS